jgi:CheY-like chemotaxis protein
MSAALDGSRPAVILLAEDNENDVILTREGFRRSKLLVDLHHVHDGEECMEFLRRQGKYADAPTPDLVLLDMNMPRMNGREVLAAIVADENLKHIPVVVLTTSSAEQDVYQMYKLRCSGYIVKPVDFEQFAEVLRRFSDYWFTVVVLPPGQSR